VKDLVCFRSSFAYESAPNITHMTLDGKRTACGRSNWATTEGWHDAGPDCLRCRKAWEKMRLSTEQRARARHPGFDSEDHCTRCALHDDDRESRAAENCPPGFWMNNEETKAWSKGFRYVDE